MPKNFKVIKFIYRVSKMGYNQNKNSPKKKNCEKTRLSARRKGHLWFCKWKLKKKKILSRKW